MDSVDWNNGMKNDPGYIVTDTCLTTLSSEKYIYDDSIGPFYLHGLTLIRAWISNYMPRKRGMKLLIHS